MNHFTGGDPTKLRQIDEKFHGKDYLKTLMLLNSEIKDIIDPALASPAVDNELKKYLLTKKKSLMLFQDVRAIFLN